MDFLNPKLTKIIYPVSGLTILLLTVIKYSCGPSNLPTVFISLELSTWIVIVLTIFYLFNLQVHEKNKNNKLNDEKKLLKEDFQKRESSLLQKIMDLEAKEKDKELFSLHKTKTLNRIYSSFDTTTSDKFIQSVLPALSSVIETVTGIVYWYDSAECNFVPKATYAMQDETNISPVVANEGFGGQAIAERRLLQLNDIPEDYFVAQSGLGAHVPRFIYFAPIEINGQVMGLIEMGSFKKLELDAIWPDINIKIGEIAQTLIKK